MGDSTNTSHTTSASTKSKIKTRGATMMTKVSKAHEIGVLFPIGFCPKICKDYGEHAESLGVTHYKVEEKSTFF